MTGPPVPPVPPAPDDARSALVRAFADEWGRVVATLIRVTGDWSLAEDCAQEAFAAAATRWPHDGVPTRPGAWLTTTARNAALDRLRRRATEARKLRERATMDLLDATSPAPDGPEDVPDDRLRLVFTCCHPALPLEARVALTLRTLCGLTVPEIARAFGTSEAAMARRLVRARQKIAHAGIPYREPDAAHLPERLHGVLAVLYLLFTEGYSATAGATPVRAELCVESIRLTRALAVLLPAEAEVHAVLALMLLHDARRPARLGPAGELVPLEEQDRSSWDAGRVQDGLTALRTAQRLAGTDAPYLLQAEIAACHSTAPDADGTPWAAIASLYDRLLAVAPSPHAALSRAVAVGMAEGPRAGLEALEEVAAAGGLTGSPYLPAARADLLRRAGRRSAAASAYRAALELAPTAADRRSLQRRLDECASPPAGADDHGRDGDQDPFVL